MSRLAILSDMRKNAVAGLPNTCTINSQKDRTLLAIGMLVFSLVQLKMTLSAYALAKWLIAIDQLYPESLSFKTMLL